MASKKMSGYGAKGGVLSGLFFDKLIQYALEPVAVTDSKGMIVFANKEYLDYFGIKRDKAIGAALIDVVAPESLKEEARKVFSEVKKRKTLSFFETPYPAARHADKYLYWVAIPFRKGRTVFFLFVGGEKKGKGRKRPRLHAPHPAKFTAAHRDLVDMLVEASWASEPGTAKHSARVMMFAVELAKRIRLNKERIARLKIASLLHDLGKLGIDEKILFKKGKLDKVELAEIRKHPHWGSDAVKHLYFLKDILPIMADHHENYDGSGYPRGIKGKRIPIEARVLSVADVYEALTADRPYRKGFSKGEAIRIIEEEKGHKLDPAVTEVFLKMVRKKDSRW